MMLLLKFPLSHLALGSFISVSSCESDVDDSIPVADVVEDQGREFSPVNPCPLVSQPSTDFTSWAPFDA